MDAPSQKQEWSKPELTRLGNFTDVTQFQPGDNKDGPGMDGVIVQGQQLASV